MVEFEKTTVFIAGRGQAVLIPEKYHFKSDEVYIHHNPQTGEIKLSEKPIRPPLTKNLRDA